MINSAEEYFTMLIQKQQSKGLKMDGRITLPVDDLKKIIQEVWDYAIHSENEEPYSNNTNTEFDHLVNSLFGSFKK
jgi:hypothetical protein